MTSLPVIVLKIKIFFFFLVCHIGSYIHRKNFILSVSTSILYKCSGGDDLNNYRKYVVSGKRERNVTKFEES